MTSLMAVGPGDRALVRRSLAVVAAAIYGATCLLVIAVLFDEGDLQPVVAVILLGTFCAAVMLAWGSIKWTARGAPVARGVSWLVMFACSVFLISFALVLWGVLLLAAPAAMARAVPADPPPGGGKKKTAKKKR